MMRQVPACQAPREPESEARGRKEGRREQGKESSCYGEVEMVIKSVIDPRFDGHLHLREGLLDNHGHDVRGGVT